MLLRYRIVESVLNPLDSELSCAQLCEKAAEKRYELSDGQVVEVSAYTISRWVRKYKRGGLKALEPVERKDSGIQRKLTPEIKNAIIELIKQFPRTPATVIMERLVTDGTMEEGELSLSTVSRFVRRAKRDLKIQDLIPEKELRRYEKENINMVWYGDSTYTIAVRDDKGKKRMVYIIALIDDASRMILACGAFFHDNTESLIQVMKSAFETYGKPELITFDNGKNYKSDQVKYLGARLGVSLNYAPPYTPTSKAKIERFFKTLKTQWLSGISDEEYSSLDNFRKSLNSYIHKYNNTVHSALSGKTPTGRYLSQAELLKPIDDPDFDRLFLFEAQRKVSRDGVISLERCEYEADFRFAQMKVTIRYTPDKSEVYIEENGKLYPLKKLDLIDNGKAKRKGVRFSDAGKEVE